MDVGRPFYHDGMRDFQDRFDGRRVADALEKHRIRHDFWDADRALIASTPFFFITTSFGEFTDCSLKSGVPGFVKIVGATSRVRASGKAATISATSRQ